jgi:hypothetical protein
MFIDVGDYVARVGWRRREGKGKSWGEDRKVG